MQAPSLRWAEQPRDLLLGAAAVYRLTRLVTEDEILRPWRERLTAAAPTGRLAYLVTCPWCVSVWAAGVLGAALTAAPHLTRAGCAVLAWSAAAGWLSGRE